MHFKIKTDMLIFRVFRLRPTIQNGSENGRVHSCVQGNTVNDTEL
jgi:hypothetical protein